MFNLYLTGDRFLHNTGSHLIEVKLPVVITKFLFINVFNNKCST